MYPTVYWGELLRDLRMKHYMLQKEVAIVLHISRQSYSNMENGRTQPTPEQLSALSFIYDVNLLDYVRKCLPPSFAAEQMAYRAIQTKRVYEVQLEEEEKAKKKASRSRKISQPEPELQPEPEAQQEPEPPQESEYEQKNASYNNPDIIPVSADPFVAEPVEYKSPKEESVSSIPARTIRKKRDPAVQYHNTSNMSSIELLLSKKAPRSSGITADAFMGKFDFEKKDDVPKKKRGRPKKEKTPEIPPVEPPKIIPDNLSKPAPVIEAEPPGPMPPELLRELFPPESPYKK